MTSGKKISIKDISGQISADAEVRFVSAFTRGELEVEYYIPKHNDAQTPHDRDECYFITKGKGQFLMGSELIQFESGDFIFVPAGVEHRFIDFGDSMETWVLFYGPVHDLN